MTTWLWLLLNLLTPIDDAGAPPPVAISWHGSRIQLIYQGKTIVHDFGQRPSPGPQRVYQLFTGGVDKATTDSVVQKDGMLYLLLDVWGASNAGSQDGQCAGGDEEAKVFFALNAQGEAKPTQVVLYKSCWLDIEPAPDDSEFHALLDGHAIARALVYQIDPRGTIERHLHIAFDPDHPDLGLQTAEQCFLAPPEPFSGAPVAVACPAANARIK